MKITEDDVGTYLLNSAEQEVFEIVYVNDSYVVLEELEGDALGVFSRRNLFIEFRKTTYCQDEGWL